MTPELARTHTRNLDRAWAGANYCRDRLAARTADAPVIRAGQWTVTDLRDSPAHDVDYYAWEAVRIVKIAQKVVASGLPGKDGIEAALAGLRAAAPDLEAFRNAVTHVEDNRKADDVTYFGEAVRVLADGRVVYLVDPRHGHHDRLRELHGAVQASLRRALA